MALCGIMPGSVKVVRSKKRLVRMNKQKKNMGTNVVIYIQKKGQKKIPKTSPLMIIVVQVIIKDFLSVLGPIINFPL